jgi:hypothetical protein
MNTNGEGVAVCRCGSELHIVCTGGCPDPDVVFKSELALLSKPPDPARRPGQCRWANCPDDVAPHKGRGRPPTRCPAHLALGRKYRMAWEKKRNVAPETAR